MFNVLAPLIVFQVFAICFAQDAAEPKRAFPIRYRPGVVHLKTGADYGSVASGGFVTSNKSSEEGNRNIAESLQLSTTVPELPERSSSASTSPTDDSVAGKIKPKRLSRMDDVVSESDILDLTSQPFFDDFLNFSSVELLVNRSSRPQPLIFPTDPAVKYEDLQTRTNSIESTGNVETPSKNTSFTNATGEETDFLAGIVDADSGVTESTTGSNITTTDREVEATTLPRLHSTRNFLQKDSLSSSKKTASNSVSFFEESPTLLFMRENSGIIVGGILGSALLIFVLYVAVYQWRRYRSGRLSVCRATIDWQVCDQNLKRRPLAFTPSSEAPLVPETNTPNTVTPECIIHPRRLTSFTPSPTLLPKSQ